GPSEEEGGDAPPPFHDVDVNAAGLGVRTSDLGERERTAEGDEATEHPERQHGEWARQPVSNACGRAKDSGSNGGSDENGDGAPEADAARQCGRHQQRYCNGGAMASSFTL